MMNGALTNKEAAASSVACGRVAFRRTPPPTPHPLLTPAAAPPARSSLLQGRRLSAPRSSGGTPLVPRFSSLGVSPLVAAAVVAAIGAALQPTASLLSVR